MCQAVSVLFHLLTKAAGGGAFAARSFARKAPSWHQHRAAAFSFGFERISYAVPWLASGMIDCRVADMEVLDVDAAVEEESETGINP